MQEPNTRNIAPVVRRVKMKEAADGLNDLTYWLSQPVRKRAEAVTFLISQMLTKGQRMNKSALNRISPAQ
ncbi:hypothetical protein [Filimonas effusa]|uniref:Uncharacterized protein n=1 Tax=Filimonas effusa TaxID=2508721 RepID=A0A4Q1D113_9BACT|nr:hypothetical protein [Filimonas effusa]RXK81466.1 hypothetical protein ESB13_21285 [Filimonas effusa]